MRVMPSFVQSTLALSLLLLTQAVQAGLILSDAVEGTGGWQISGNTLHFFGANTAGLSPTAGVDMMHLQNIGGRVASKSFSALSLQAGTYTLSFDIGRFNNAPLASIDTIGMTVGGALRAATSESKPTHTGGGTWQTWSLVYDIAFGDLALGQGLGFALTSANSGQNRNGAFDNLRIDFVAASAPPAVPEPGAGALVGVALAGLALARRRMA